jgi:hypothetical protein
MAPKIAPDAVGSSATDCRRDKAGNYLFFTPGYEDWAMAFSIRRPDFRNILGEAGEVWRRFPLAMACACLATLFFVAEGLLDGIAPRDLNWRLFTLFLTGSFVMIALCLFGESRGWPAWLKVVAGLGVLLLLSLQAAFAYPLTTSIWEEALFTFLPLAALLSVSFAGFLTRDRNDDAFWHGNRRIWTSLAFGLLTAILVAAGFVGVLLALDFLFGVDVDDGLYFYTWAVALGVLWPWRSLAGVPSDEDMTRIDGCPKAVAFLVTYVLVPTALIYLLLLYAYALQILVSWTLPEGKLGFLICGFAAVGVIAYLCGYPLRDTGKSWVRFFQRHFLKLLLLPVGLLAMAAFVRIQAYGFTPPRVFLTAVALWLAILSLGHITGFLRRLFYIPASLAALLLLGSFGPWGAYDLSIRSQVGRLTEILETEGVISQGRVTGEKHEIGSKRMAEINDIFWFLSRMGSLEEITPRAEPEKLTCENCGVYEIQKAFGLPELGQYYDDDYFSINNQNGSALEIAGFQHLTNFARTVHRYEDGDEIESSDGIYRYHLTKSALVLTDPAGRKLRFDLATWALAERFRQQDYSDQSWAILEERQGPFRARLIVRQANGQVIDDKAELNYLQAVLLLGQDPQ